MILNKNLFKKHILWYNYKDIKVLVLKDINTFCYEFSFLYIKLEVYLKWGEIVAKKKSKKKKAKESNFTAEYNNLITIFVGIFLLYSLSSESMGLLGTLMQSVFKGLFGKLSIIVPFMFIGGN